MSIAEDHPSLGAAGRVAAAMRTRRSFVSLATVRPDLVEVTVDRRTLGYIEQAGGVFVALAGIRYDLAVEVHQTLIFEDALTALREG